MFYYDKIEPEAVDQKDPEKHLFSAGKPFPHFTGVHCVCPANSLGKNWHVYYSEGVE